MGAPVKGLIIDDDDAISAFVEALLGDAGWEFDRMSSADGLTERLRLTPYDVVILDYEMPGTDGLMALRQLRAAKLLVPVIMLSGNASQTLAIECFRAGANDFIGKPFDPDYLQFIVDRTAKRTAPSLINLVYRLIGYARHREGCDVATTKQCTCGFLEVMKDIPGETQAT